MLLDRPGRRAPSYDESKIPPYTLPEPLVLADGSRVGNAATWRGQRRPQIVALFEKYVYGKALDGPQGMTFELRSKAEALAGIAVRKEVTIRLAADPKAPRIHVLIYLPKAADRPAALFLALNFLGNQAVHRDPGITLAESSIPNDPALGITDNRVTERLRGVDSRRWPLEKILARGYGLATAYYGDIEPDRKDGIGAGVRPLFFKPGQTRPATGEWARSAPGPGG